MLLKSLKLLIYNASAKALNLTFSRGRISLDESLQRVKTEVITLNPTILPRQQKTKKSYPGLRSQSMSVWSRGTFSALALRRSVAHIPFIQKEAHWFERSRSNKWQPIESCNSKERRVISTSLGIVVSLVSNCFALTEKTYFCHRLYFLCSAVCMHFLFLPVCICISFFYNIYN